MRVFGRVLACFPARFHVEIYIKPDGFHVEILRFYVGFVLCFRLFFSSGCLWFAVLECSMR
jgi:hypothetical protein